MRVAIDATALGTARGGDDTHVRAVILGLAALLEDGAHDQFPLLVRPGAAIPSAAARPEFPIHHVGGNSVIRHTLSIPAALRAAAPIDLLHSALHAPPISPVPVVLHVADISFRRHPEFFPPLTRLRLNLLVPLHVKQATIVTTVSEFSRQDLIAAYGLSPERVLLIPDAVIDVLSDPHPPTPIPHTAPPYFCYLGNLHPRKNVPRLIQAFLQARRSCPELSEHQLVIAGGAWWGGAREEELARGAPPGSIRLLGRVSNEERSGLLRGAAALVYPSLFEGFGLPPVEAMALGTPVLAANVSAMPEVLGDAALLVNPLSTDAIAEGLVRLGTSPGLRAELSRRGLERAARYTTRATGEAALRAFRFALSRAVQKR